MKYLNRMTDEEIKYICDVIPPDEVQYYLRQNPKEFAKLKPGFRTTSVKTSQTPDILYSFRNRMFIRSFIEKYIGRWMGEIRDHIQMCLNKGDTKYQAYIRTFSESFFCKNIELYFKLSREKIDSEIVEVISDAVTVFGSEKNSRAAFDEDGLRKKLEQQFAQVVEVKEKEIKKAKKEYAKLGKKITQQNEIITANYIKINDLSQQVSEASLEIENLNKENKYIEVAYRNVEKDREAQSKKIIILSERIQEAEAGLEKAKEQIYNLQEEIDKSKFEIIGDSVTIRPKEMDQFKEFLGYNIENLGVNMTDSIVQLLIDYISHIVFLGYPILINRATEHSLVSCIANSLIGSSEYETLIYTKGITAKEIVGFLNNSGRLVCLNGFMGQYEENELFEIMNKYKSKIIFLSIAYEKTLKYLPKEIFTYCAYINVLRIPEFLTAQTLNEDGAVMEETPFIYTRGVINKIVKRTGEEIFNELGFSEQIISKYISFISDEQTLNQLLIFSILPYISDVWNCNPYSKSNRLQRFAGDGGKSSYSSTMLEWFDRDYE